MVYWVRGLRELGCFRITLLSLRMSLSTLIVNNTCFSVHQEQLQTILQFSLLIRLTEGFHCLQYYSNNQVSCLCRLYSHSWAKEDACYKNPLVT